MQLPSPRGPLSADLFGRMRHGDWPTSHGSRSSAPVPETKTRDVVDDEDVQISLWALYEMHYRGFSNVDPALEWDPDLLTVRRRLEIPFEQALRDETEKHVEPILEAGDDLSDRLFGLCESFEAPGLAEYVKRDATADQLREILLHRSVFQLKEADPYSWAIPRLTSGAKAALVELQYDEYGDGHADRVHQDLFAETLRCAGLDPAYGGYVDVVPATTLALSNAPSMFGLHRRLRAAAMGHLGAFEATSALPSHKYAAGIRRLGFGDDVAFYFDEHVEADAVHEHLALRGICAAIARDDPVAERDVVFGAVCCLMLDAQWAERLMGAWRDGSHLVAPPAQSEQVPA